MRSSVAALRDQVDLCPGALTVHEAADGGLARIRLPGGAVSSAQLRTLATAAAELGGGRLELTSRGNVQIRALPVGAEIELGQRLAAVGLLPSATHERVRNIVASPLAGIDAPDAYPPGLVAELDRELCSRPGLAALPGRFLFAIDDGRGDVARLGADVALVAHPAAGRASIGSLDLPLGSAVQVMLAMAEAFLAERGVQRSQAWRIGELAGGLPAVTARALPALSGAGVVPGGSDLPPAPPEPAGVIAQPQGLFALAVLAPLGRLSAAQANLLAEFAGPGGLRITPWRSIVVPDLVDSGAAAEAASAAGLGVDAASPWYRVSACTGRPGCAKALADVQADAAAEAGRWPGRQVHWSGCARGCGRPHGTEVDVVATAGGYAINE
ncbi:MAG: precorrin-3B synthase [Pseudonocardiales bacterium]|nr:MAG: precorrin-3B synthase [Pseudonocardiales bacterium]